MGAFFLSLIVPNTGVVPLLRFVRMIILNESKGEKDARKKFFQKISQNFAKTPPSRRSSGERGRKDLPPGTKGGEKMTPDRHREHKQHTFDTFCKKALRCEMRSYYKEMRRRNARQVSLSELPEEVMEQLAVYDTYSWEYTPFIVGETVILIKNDNLAKALMRLSQQDREIILMYWFLDMADSDIADEKCMNRRSVNYRRLQTYQRLKELMGGETDG